MPFAHAQQTGHRIWYHTAGESGTPVLLIMGFTMRGTAWRWQIGALSERHRVAWFDHAGLGRSAPVATRRLTMGHLAADALTVMDDLGWERAHVVGISMGGMIAQHVALSSGPRVRSLTLAATHCGGFPNVLPPLEGMRAFVAIQRAGSRDERLDALAKLLFGPNFRTEEAERCRKILLADFTRPPELKTTLAQLHAILRHRTADRLKELRSLPVMIVRPGPQSRTCFDIRPSIHPLRTASPSPIGCSTWRCHASAPTARLLAEAAPQRPSCPNRCGISGAKTS